MAATMRYVVHADLFHIAYIVPEHREAGKNSVSTDTAMTCGRLPLTWIWPLCQRDRAETAQRWAGNAQWRCNALWRNEL